MSRQAILLFFMSIAVSGFNQSDSFKRAFEFGVMGGGSYYIGDLNPLGHFIYSKPACGLIMRYNLSTRHSMRITTSYGNVCGADSKSNDSYQLNRNLSFNK